MGADRRPRPVVITGTDTGVGKTYVGCRLARALRAEGVDVRAVKPLESGCAPGVPGANEDGARLARASGQPRPTAALVRLIAPLAPPLAAEREGRELDFDALVDVTRFALEGADVALVEGAGGLLAPLTWERNALHLAEELGAACLVVAADRLGTLNHALLTVGALHAAGVACLGVVMSAPDRDGADLSTGTNAAALRRALAGVPWRPPVYEVGRDGDVPAELVRAVRPA